MGEFEATIGARFGYPKEAHMARSVLDGKRILAVDDEPDVLEVLKEEIMSAAPEVPFRDGHHLRAGDRSCWRRGHTTFSSSISWVFAALTSCRAPPVRDYPIPTVMLTAHAFSPDALKKSIELGARAYLPKERLGAMVPFLEDVLTYEYGPVWKRLLKEVEGVFSKEWGPYWRKPNDAFWKEFEAKIAGK